MTLAGVGTREESKRVYIYGWHGGKVKRATTVGD